MVEITEKDLGFFSIFEKIAGVMPSDYYESDNVIVFIINPFQLGRVIGKKGSNIEKLRNAFRKKVIVVGDSDNAEAFIKNFFNNVRIIGIEPMEIMGETALMVTIDERDRGIAIGKDGERIKALKELLKKKFKATIHLRTRRVLE